MSAFIPSAVINGVQFSLGGNDYVEKGSVVNITAAELFQNNSPYASGPCDAHLGVADYSYKCSTCYNDKKHCLGHDGHISLNQAIWNPIALTESRKWLKLICFNCGKPVLSEVDISQMYPVRSRLDMASKIARGSGKKCTQCFSCGQLHPVIKRHSTEPLAVIGEYYDDRGAITDTITVFAYIAERVFSMISDETVKLLGKSVLSHPRNFVLRSIKVPPVAIRPDARKSNGPRSSNDSLTVMLQAIIKRNAAIPRDLQVIDKKTEKMLFDLNTAFYTFVRGTGDANMVSLGARIKGKRGRLRQTLLGKRVHNMVRSVIIGDATLKIDELGLPLRAARTVQMKEVVQTYNYQYLLSMVQNGRRAYPGATKVIKHSTGVEHDTEAVNEIDLEIEDVVLRDLVTGDVVLFNRQPSLQDSAITAHYVVVKENNDETLSINPIVCSLYGADFDGDECNIIVLQSACTRNEIEQLQIVSTRLITAENGAPQLGEITDSVQGPAQMTRVGINYAKYQSQLLFSNSTAAPVLEFAEDGSDKVTGRSIISRLFDDTPINFNKPTEWYKPNYTQFMQYNPDEITLKIKHGTITSGILDKKNIKKGTVGSIFHVIANEYGNDKSLEVMFNMQQMAIAHTLQQGCTMGIMDLLLPAKTMEEIHRINADVVNKSQIIIDRLNSGGIIPPIGKTVEEFYEESQLNVLRILDEFTPCILGAIDHDLNNLFGMISYGSTSGSVENMFSMNAAIGQRAINGERIRQKFGFRRTLAYFRRFETAPAARGYVFNSYFSGLSSSEMVFCAMAARYDLITKALGTSITGQQNRDSIKNFETAVVNNHRAIVKGRNVVQLVYGEDYLNARKVERVKMPTVLISDAEFESTYKHKDFPAFFEKMRSDREKYRKIFLAIERQQYNALFTSECKLAVDVQRVVNDILTEYEDMLGAVETPLKSLVDAVADFCTCIKYIPINSIQEGLRTHVPEFITKSTWLVRMLIRTHLHPNMLAKTRLTMPILEIIMLKIKTKYLQALIAPGTVAGILAAQSFSAPMTQYMLDAHKYSALGGTRKSGITKGKEILGAKPVSKLSSPSMFIRVLPEFEGEKSRVQEIANHIEMVKMTQFVEAWQIFYEKYGEPVHSAYKHEAALVREFMKFNPILTPPSDLTKWCIRFSIKREVLILKNISLEFIISRLRELFVDYYIVHSPENATAIVVRVYIRNAASKTALLLDGVVQRAREILATIVRGVERINEAVVVPLYASRIDETGAVVKVVGKYCIKTTGTNLIGVMCVPGVDPYKITTDAIQEMASVFGVEAGRRSVIFNMKDIVGSIDHRHILMFADEMSYNGKITSVERGGVKSRESSNILLRMGFSAPMATIEEAAINAAEDTISGITAPLLVGAMPKYGTLYNQFHVNEKFVRENVITTDAQLDALEAL